MIVGKDGSRSAGDQKSVEAVVTEEIEERTIGVERATVAIDRDADRQLVENGGVDSAPGNGVGERRTRDPRGDLEQRLDAVRKRTLAQHHPLGRRGNPCLRRRWRAKSGVPR